MRIALRRRQLPIGARGARASRPPEIERPCPLGHRAERAPADRAAGAGGTPALRNGGGLAIMLPSCWFLRLGILAITLAGFGARCYSLGQQDLRGDESFAAVFAAQSLPAIWQALGHSEPHPPLYYALLHWTIGLAGPSAYALRAPSVWFGSLAIPALAMAGWRVAGRRAAALAAALAALNPLLIWQSQDARMYAQLAACLALALAGALWILRDARRSTSPWIAFVVGIAGALLTHFYAVFAVAGLGGAALLWAGLANDEAARRAGLLLGLLSIAALVLLAAPLLYYSRQALTDHPAFTSLLLPALVADMARTLAGGLTLPRSLYGAATVLGMALPLLGLGVTWRQGRVTSALLIATMAAPLAALAILELTRPAYQSPYAAVVAPAWLVAVATLGAGRWWGRLAGAATAIALGGLAVASLFTYAHQDKGATWRLAAQMLLSDSAPGDTIVINYPDPGLRWVYQRQLGGGLPVLLEPASLLVDPQALDGQMVRIGDRYQRIWFWTRRTADWDPRYDAELWLDRHALPLATRRAGDVEFRLFLTPTGFLAGTSPLPDVSFGDQLRVRGAQIGASNVVHGGALSVALCWQAIARPTTDYTAFVHLERQGTLGGQDDHPPINGLNPTSAWQPGESFLDRYDVHVLPNAASGVYEVRVGFYAPATLRRLPVLTSNGDVVGDAVTVGEVIVR